MTERAATQDGDRAAGLRRECGGAAGGARADAGVVWGIEACGWDREPPRFLVHNRDSRYGTTFHHRVRNLGITSIRTPFRSPQANAIAERWVRSVRNDCLDHLLILNERHLRRVLVEHVEYFNHWRPHRPVGRRAPCAQAPPLHHWDQEDLHVVARSVLGGLHHVYDLAV